MRNLKNFNSQRFLEDLQAQPWAQLSFYEADVNAMWSCWKTMFLDVLDSHAPIRSKRVRNRPSLPWLSKDIRDKMLERYRLKRLAIIKNDCVSLGKYGSSRNIVNVALRKVNCKSQIENITGNPKNGLGKQLMILSDADNEPMMLRISRLTIILLRHQMK